MPAARVSAGRQEAVRARLVNEPKSTKKTFSLKSENNACPIATVASPSKALWGTSRNQIDDEEC
jgi:hypothetical protein